jgi:predicted small secreted protein
MKKVLAAIAALSLCTGGCATLQGALGSAPQAAGTAVQDGAKALIVAHNGFQAAEALVAPLIRSRALTASQVDLVGRIVDRADALFTTAGNGLSDAERAQQIIALTAQLNALAGR